MAARRHGRGGFNGESPAKRGLEGRWSEDDAAAATGACRRGEVYRSRP